MRLPRLFRRKSPVQATKALSPISPTRGAWFRILESFSGAWQQNVEVNYDTVVANHAVFACVTLIASDIAKLGVKLIQQEPNRIWVEAADPNYSPVLRKPNHYQSSIQFWESWMLSKLLRGNTYVLKERDARGVVVRLYVLDPTRVTPMVADDGGVFYEAQPDNLTGRLERVLIPASEIIHDRFNCLFHPLVGISPLFASGLAATQAQNIQNSSTKFFGNRSLPAGILYYPGAPSDEDVAAAAASWQSLYSGANAGKVAVLADDLKFEPLSITAEDAQLIEQLKWSAQMICSTFKVPPYKIGMGPMPTYNNIQSLNLDYYTTCLQSLIEQAEECLAEGLGLAETLWVQFNTKQLLRMDSVTQMAVLKEGVGAGIMSPNEGRLELDLAPTPGGDAPYLQQQNYSLDALARRDSAAAETTTDVQAEALNGAQVTALQGLIVAAAAGQLPAATVSAVISAAFPLMSDSDVAAIMSPLQSAPPAPAPAEPGAEERGLAEALIVLFTEAPAHA